MKKINIAYWVVTILLAALMAFGAIPDAISHPEAVKMVCDHLHYPPYFLPFIGIAKLLGAIAILVPGFPKLKEWAYAGFFFDITGAVYSSMAVGDPPSAWAMTIVLGYGLIFGSYFLYHRRRKAMVHRVSMQPA
jgi:uncharacterized membrane protein YphA (DoxX/SURF4 family)